MKTVADFPPGLLAVPSVEWMWTKTASALVRLCGALPPKSGVLFGSELGSGLTTPAANRNVLTQALVMTPHYQWICYLDSDMTPASDALLRLLAAEKDIIGARYFGRVPPFDPIFFPLPDREYYENCPDPCPVQSVGGGMLLVRRKVIEKMPFPWFEHTIPGLGEDTFFCEKAGKLGFETFLHCGVDVGHVSPRVVTAAEAFAFHGTPLGYQMLAHNRSHRLPDSWSQADRRHQEFDENGVAPR